MDYSMAAVKLLIAQLQPAQELHGAPGGANVKEQGKGNIQCHQTIVIELGIIVEGPDKESLWLDDGSGVLELLMDLQSWRPGMYVLVVGAYKYCTNGLPFLQVHKIVDLSSFPNREALWNLEVIEAHHLFYKSLISSPVADPKPSL